MISWNKNFLFVHIPKTAGNAIQTALAPYAEDVLASIHPFHDGVEEFGIRNPRFDVSKHSTLKDYQRVLGDENLERLFKFCCVRNPWERMVSYYFSPSRGPANWQRQAFSDHTRRVKPAAHYVTLDEVAPGSSPFDNVDFIVRFERLESDFRGVCERLRLPVEPLPVRNRSSHEHYSHYYDDELIELVREKCSEEIVHFDYKFESS